MLAGLLPLIYLLWFSWFALLLADFMLLLALLVLLDAALVLLVAALMLLATRTGGHTFGPPQFL